MLCPNCHVTIEPDMRFCPNCGYRLRPVPTSSYQNSTPHSNIFDSQQKSSNNHTTTNTHSGEQYPVYPTIPTVSPSQLSQYPEVPTYRNTDQYYYQPPTPSNIQYPANPVSRESSTQPSSYPSYPGQIDSTAHLDFSQTPNSNQHIPQPSPSLGTPNQYFSNPNSASSFQQSPAQNAYQVKQNNFNNRFDDQEERSKNYGVGHSKKTAPQRSILLPPEEYQEDDYDDFDEYEDDDYLYEKPKKSRKGLFFLLFLLIVIAALTILQLLGTIKIQEWPNVIISKFSNSETDELLISSEETLSLISEETDSKPAPVGMDAGVTTENWSLSIDNAEILNTVGDIKAPEGYDYLKLQVTFSYNPTDTEDPLRYSNYDYTLSDASTPDAAPLTSESFPDYEGALALIKVEKGQTLTNTIFFRIPQNTNNTAGYILYFTPRGTSSPKAAFQISIVPPEETPTPPEETT